MVEQGCAPLDSGSHADAVAYSIVDGGLIARLSDVLAAGLARPDQLVGWRGAAD